MREPAFWWQKPSPKQSWQSRLLAPVSIVYGAVASRRMQRAGSDAGVPVICVGNYHVGGAGKTPVAIAVTQMLRARGERPFLLSRGYGGRLRGPVLVDTVAHGAVDVGDEPLLLARAAPTIVARDRRAGADLARTMGASVIVMDDGFQNPALRKSLSLIVVDAGRGVGNGAVFPSGPLRASLPVQIARTDALIVVGEGDAEIPVRPDVPVLRGKIVADEASIAPLRGKRLLAFAGIGDPVRFFETLTANGLELAAAQTFADHHRFTSAELRKLIAEAARNRFTLVTTEKDFVRIGKDADLAPLAQEISTIAIRMAFDDAPTLERILSGAITPR